MGFVLSEDNNPDYYSEQPASMDLMSLNSYFIKTLLVVILAQDADQQAAERARLAAEAAQRAEEQRAAQRDMETRERSQQALREFLTDSRIAIANASNRSGIGVERQRRIQYQEFLNAFRSFQGATQGLGEALGFKAKLKDPARKLEKSTASLLDFLRRTNLDFLKQTNKERLRFDSSEFKDFTVSELGWEALATSERIAPQLAAVIQNENADSVDVEFLMSLRKLEMELLRLRWMTRTLK